MVQRVVFGVVALRAQASG